MKQLWLPLLQMRKVRLRETDCPRSYSQDLVLTEAVWSHSTIMAPSLFFILPFVVVESCLKLCNPMDCSKPDLPIHHKLLEHGQINQEKREKTEITNIRNERVFITMNHMDIKRIIKKNTKNISKPINLTTRRNGPIPYKLSKLTEEK